MHWRPLGILFCCVLIVGLFAYVYHKGPMPAVQNFTVEGNIVKDNPGLIPNTWYLIYEEPGKPGLSVQLLFDLQSRCVRDATPSPCDMSFTQGERVTIEGVRTGDLVRVTVLSFVKPEVTGVPIKLFYYDPEKDKDAAGNIQCSRHGLVSVDRVLPPGGGVDDAIDVLLRGEISDDERARGVTTEFPLPGVTRATSTLTGGTLTLTFDDPQNKTGGGSCRVAILWAQIEATARQFPGVTQVKFMPEELFQP